MILFRTMVRNVFTGMLCLFLSTGVCSAGDGIKTAGDIGQLLLPATAYTLTFTRHDRAGRKMFYKSYFSSMALSYALKYSIDDNRPNGSTNENSFISAHTASAFGGAAFIQRRYGWKLGVPAYAAASFVGWSRIHAKAHNTDDVIRGAAIGVAGAYLFTRPIGKDWVMSPIIGSDVVGVSFTKRW